MAASDTRQKKNPLYTGSKEKSKTWGRRNQMRSLHLEERRQNPEKKVRGDGKGKQDARPDGCVGNGKKAHRAAGKQKANKIQGQGEKTFERQPQT